MDNITHTVIGLVAGDALHSITNPRKMPSVERRRLFLLSSVLANNVPDLDIFLARLLPSPIGSLLHHRGYTHTLIYILPQAMLVMVFLLLLRGSILSKKLSFTDWAQAFGTSALGVGLHISLDALNSYGVHPFYPFNNNWYYGDLIFIVEPFLWAVAGAWILLELPLIWRALYFAIFSFVIGYGFSLEAIELNNIIILISLLCALTLIIGLLAPSRRAILSLILCALVLGFFSSKTKGIREMVTNEYEQAGLPQMKDLALSPSPTNPYCWTALAATVEEKIFVIRKASISLWPSEFSNQDCRLLDRASNPVTKVRGNASQRQAKATVDWFREFRTPLALFSAYSTDCYLKDWLRFARMPQIQNGRAVDVRFSSRGLNNFTELRLQPGRLCLTKVPPWNPPRKFLTE